MGSKYSSAAPPPHPPHTSATMGVCPHPYSRRDAQKATHRAESVVRAAGARRQATMLVDTEKPHVLA
eukprot:gene481-20881_t